MTDDLEQQLGVRLTALAERAPSQAVTRSGVARRVRQRAVRRRAALCAGDVAFAGAVAGAFALRPSSSSHVTAGGPTTTTAERDLPLATTVGERVPRPGLADPSVQITGVDGPIATTFCRRGWCS